MNKITTLSAIAMFAVIMGMSAFAPAMATPNNDKSSATTAVCHFFAVYQVDEEGELILDENDEPILDEELSAWIVLHTSSKGAEKGHQKHGDVLVTNDAEALACVTNQDGTVTTIEV